LPTQVATGNQKVQALRQGRRARRLARYEEVKQREQQGISISQIARQTGLDRKTIRGFLLAESFPERQAPGPRASQIDPFVGYLKKRWQEGCHTLMAVGLGAFT
jgi:transposase